MTDLPAPRLPGFAAAFAEQVRVVGLAVRPQAAGLALVLLAAGILRLLDVQDSGGEASAFPIPPVLMIVLGALSPFAVWKGEQVFGHAHLFTLPVEKRRHALAKVLAGGLWLTLAVAAIQLALIGLALATGGSVGESETRMMAGPGGVQDLVPVRWSTPAWQWATPFTTALVCYVIGSAFMLGAKYPLRWGTAAVAAFLGVGLLGEFGIVGGLPQLLFEQANMGPFGINQAIGVGVANEIEGAPPAPGSNASMLVLWYSLPSLETWGRAVLAWAAAACIALWIAASRHREG